MVNKDIREILDEMFEDEDDAPLLFENPPFDNSIVGISNDERIVYDMSKMVEEFMADNECSREEAYEFIEYNSLGAIPYFGIKSPIVIVSKIED